METKMIDFEIPEKITNELQMAKMVAESIMRQYSRYYDEHEHERPVEYINMMWPIMREQYKRRTEKLQLNGNGSGPQKKEGPDYSIVRLIFMIEMLSWGDAGQYLCTPDRKSTRLNSSHQIISYAVFCLKKKKNHRGNTEKNTKKNQKKIIHNLTKQQ